MRSLSKATVIGHVGSEVVKRFTQTGKPVVNLRVATNDRRKDGSESTTWHRVVFFDKLADVAHQYARKGTRVFVEGSLVTRDWVDKDGGRHSQHEIIGRDLLLLGGKPGELAADAAPEEAADVAEAVAPEGAGDGPAIRYARPGRSAPDGEELEEVVAEIPF